MFSHVLVTTARVGESMCCSVKTNKRKEARTQKQNECLMQQNKTKQKKKLHSAKCTNQKSVKYKKRQSKCFGHQTIINTCGKQIQSLYTLADSQGGQFWLE